MTSPFSTGRRGVAYTGAGTAGSFSQGGVLKGADDFLRLSKALKAAGQKDLRKELHKAVAAAAKPVIPAVREDARRDLPKHGGLNERIARKPLRAQTRTGEKTAGVRIVGSKVDPRINEGRVYHPVFGRRPGVVQQVPSAKGYFTDTIARQAPEIRSAVLQVLDEFTDRIVREAK